MPTSTLTPPAKKSVPKPPRRRRRRSKGLIEREKARKIAHSKNFLVTEERSSTATRRRDRKLRNNTIRLTAAGTTKNTNTSIVTVCEKIPTMKSFCIDFNNKSDNKGILSALPGIFHESLTKVTKSIIDNLEDVVESIKPFTNSVRENFQSPQAVRIFFAKDCVKAVARIVDDSGVNRSIVRRYAYGPTAVLTSTGFHPSSGYKVRPLSGDMKTAMLALEQYIEILSGKTTKFNVVEVKMYLGKDMFPAKDDMIGKIRNNSSMQVGSHCDLQFDNNQKQKTSDSARGDHNIVTYTIGSPRDYIVQAYQTDNSMPKQKQSWTPCGPKKAIKLKHRCINVLSPDDEKPTPGDDPNSPFLYKRKHEVKMRDNGFSFAFVFRAVKETSTSLFFKDNDTWAWKHEETKTKKEMKIRDKCEKFLKQNNKQFNNQGMVNRIQNFKSSVVPKMKVNMLAYYETLQPLPPLERQLRSVAEKEYLPARTICELLRLGDHNAAATSTSKSLSQRLDLDRIPLNSVSSLRRSDRIAKKN